MWTIKVSSAFFFFFNLKIPLWILFNLPCLPGAVLRKKLPSIMYIVMDLTALDLICTVKTFSQHSLCVALKVHKIYMYVYGCIRDMLFLNFLVIFKHQDFSMQVFFFIIQQTTITGFYWIIKLPGGLKL